MKFQRRDGKILVAIHENDGVLARRQIKDLFWPHKTWRAMAYRLSTLRENEFITWPSQEQRRTKPIPEPICWLDWKGILYIAGLHGVRVKSPVRANENQMRLLQRRLRAQGTRWLREPNWSTLAHDLAVVDFRVAVTHSLHDIPFLSMENWISESNFRANMDVIEYQVQAKNGKVTKRKKGVCPDGFFTISNLTRKGRGEAYRARFLLELDMATHDNPSFGFEKAAAGAAYIRSDEYKSRFATTSGRWLVVTTGEVRMRNLMRQTKEKLIEGTDLFYFTTLDLIVGNNIFISPIWRQVDSTEAMPLPIT